MGRGRPQWNPSDDERRQIENLAGIGLPYRDIASTLGVALDTLKKHCGDELKRGKAIANAKVARTLHNKAVDGDTAAAIFWAKTQMGWRETERHELSGPDGGPIETNTVVRRVIVEPSEKTGEE